MLTKRLIPAVLLALAACAESPGTGPAPGDPQLTISRFDPLYPSDYTGFSEPARLVVDSQAEWMAVWARMWENHTPVPPVPEVDFGREVVALVAMGARPTGGYQIRVQTGEVVNDQLLLSVTEVSPGRSCATTQAFTTPVDLVRISRAGLPVRFNTTRVVRACD